MKLWIMHIFALAAFGPYQEIFGEYFQKTLMGVPYLWGGTSTKGGRL